MTRIDQILTDLKTALISAGLSTDGTNVYFAPSSSDLISEPAANLPLVWIISGEKDEEFNDVNLSRITQPMFVQVAYRYESGVTIESFEAQQADNEFSRMLSKTLWNFQNDNNECFLDGGTASVKIDKSRLADIVTASISFTLNYDEDYNNE